jgi:peroxiredoxin Q/BCP
MGGVLGGRAMRVRLLRMRRVRMLVRMLRVVMLGLRMRLMTMRRRAMPRPMLARMLGTVMIVAIHALAASLVRRNAGALGRRPESPRRGRWQASLETACARPTQVAMASLTCRKRRKEGTMDREPAAGEKAPAFNMPGDGGKTVSLEDFKGRKLVLYFYPKADTSGCTKEAIAFSGLRQAFARAETDILGVSADPVAALDKFKAKHGLKIALGSDETHKMLQAYGAWGEKSMYGRKYMGISRKTFLIDAQGRIAEVWPNVRVPGHAEAVLEAARNL